MLFRSGVESYAGSGDYWAQNPANVAEVYTPESGGFGKNTRTRKPQKRKENPVLAWHYTCLGIAVEILKSGTLECSESLLYIKEKPVIWFSKNQTWEITVDPQNNFDKVEKRSGAARFGYPAEKLFSIQHYKKHSGYLPKQFKRLAALGNQYDWLVFYEALPVSLCVVEFRYLGSWICSKDFELICGSGDPNDILTFYVDKVGITRPTARVRWRYLKINDSLQIVDTRTGRLVPREELNNPSTFGHAESY